MRVCSRNLLPLALVIFAACQDAGMTPTSPAPSSSNQTEVLHQRGDVEAIGRFEIDVDVRRNIKIGEPIQIVVTTQAHLTTEEAEIRLVLPEVESARLTEFGPGFRVPVGVPLPPAGEWRVPLTMGQIVQHTSAVVIPSGGFYRVVAAVRKLSDEPIIQDGKLVQDVAVKEVWLHLTPAGGTVVQRFDPALLPSGMVPIPSPHRTFLAAPSPSNTSGSTEVHLASTTGSAWWQVLYSDPWGGYYPLRHAYYSVDLWAGGILGYYNGTVSGYTTQDGYAWVECGEDNYRYDGLAQTYGAAVKTQPTGYAAIHGIVSQTCGNWTPHQTFAPSDAGRVFDRTVATASAAWQLFGTSRPRITVVLTSSEDNSFYRKNEDQIYIVTDANPDHIWGTFGDFVISHEYGHAYHHRALGGMNNNSGDNCNPHSLDGPSSLGCAMAEGFANYFAGATLGAYASSFEGNAFYPGGDGSVIEGAVAAFLYDATDAANEAHDAIQYPGSYVASLFNSCYSYPESIKANGIDHLLYCMENRVDATIVQSYFPARIMEPTAYSESAAEPANWSPDAIRTAWKMNLYGQN